MLCMDGGISFHLSSEAVCLIVKANWFWDSELSLAKIILLDSVVFI